MRIIVFLTNFDNLTHNNKEEDGESQKDETDNDETTNRLAVSDLLQLSILK